MLWPSNILTDSIERKKGLSVKTFKANQSKYFIYIYIYTYPPKAISIVLLLTPIFLDHCRNEPDGIRAGMYIYIYIYICMYIYIYIYIRVCVAVYCNVCST